MSWSISSWLLRASVASVDWTTVGQAFPTRRSWTRRAPGSPASRAPCSCAPALLHSPPQSLLASAALRPRKLISRTLLHQCLCATQPRFREYSNKHTCAYLCHARPSVVSSCFSRAAASLRQRAVAVASRRTVAVLSCLFGDWRAMQRGACTAWMAYGAGQQGCRRVRNPNGRTALGRCRVSRGRYTCIHKARQFSDLPISRSALLRVAVHRAVHVDECVTRRRVPPTPTPNTHPAHPHPHPHHNTSSPQHIITTCLTSPTPQPRSYPRRCRSCCLSPVPGASTRRHRESECVQLQSPNPPAEPSEIPAPGVREYTL
ncbi:hypothetical protein CC85DRAFT_55930 [Cutaneotrichosporon oleaginosum]|uniref:Uncharacterized protein n=1 Tax=Cutaneotrichosporon oleaginosum TaxID=879819 RepID=A0A0J0XYL2_9TREE|nr:uncharacterized protein CC85DRAFT_55930 [Cutaneotrichosporon oleaginosum]KLT46140.1 hypothetical protein CC85DRAFT_55930 [Cutaneotrichosporon oleaginosum]TXT10150.1 hypothetical protein COLE_04084 [Cutaneotrichosporon oleaginosum]